MYRLRPYETDYTVSEQATCMYKMKSYFECDGNSTNTSADNVISSSTSLQDLMNRQLKLFERLNALEAQVDQLLASKGVSAPSFAPIESKLKRQDKKVNVKDCVKDIVIQVDPRHIPYSVFVLFNKLSVEFKCFLKFLSHCTAASDVEKNPHCQQLHAICKALKLERQPASDYDYGFTIIWKKFAEAGEPVMFGNTYNGPAIVGEANVLRYIERLCVKTGFEKKFPPSEVLQINDIMDLTTTHLSSYNHSNKAANLFLHRVNEIVQKKKWVASNNTYSVADIYLWSVLRRQHTQIKTTSPISDWQKRLNAQEIFDCFANL